MRREARDEVQNDVYLSQNYQHSEQYLHTTGASMYPQSYHDPNLPSEFTRLPESR
jgi:hypothetical protein